VAPRMGKCHGNGDFMGNIIGKPIGKWWFHGDFMVFLLFINFVAIYIYSISHDICTKWLVSSPFWRLKSTRPFAVLSHLHHKASQPRRKYPLNIDYRCHPLTFTSINIH
jgi:hypothetical protein